MANNIISMETLKEESIRIYSGMMIRYPDYPPKCVTYEPVDGKEVEKALKFNGCYNMSYMSISFVTDNQVFVTAYSYLALRSLKAAGFRQEEFCGSYFAYSDVTFPKEEEEKWNFILDKAHQANVDDFSEECERYCDARHIGNIREETLRNCFEVPRLGAVITMQQPGFRAHYYVMKPVLTETFVPRLEYNSIRNLGRFCNNYGRIVFTYRNGKTYVAKGTKILKELEEAGYTEIAFPARNLLTGLPDKYWRFEDPNLNERWKSITE